jgi:Fe-S oxidoreductase
MIVRLVLGLLITVVALAIAARRVVFLARMVAAGQPSPGRLDDWPKRLVGQVTEVFGQVRLLKWNVPGIAHFLVFWGFIVLFLTIIEAYGHLFTETFAIPLIGRSPVLGFLEDFFAVAVGLGLIAFAVIRKRNEPKRLARDSRFYGSHTQAAWVVLGLIGLVIVTLFGIRAAQLAHGTSPWQANEWAPFFSKLLSLAIEPLGTTFAARLEDVMILAHIAVIMGFLVLVVHSKHLHIATAPINVLTKRNPEGTALGGLLPMMSKGKVLELEEADPEVDTFGVAKVEDFRWTAMLDMATCTECGRCQSQCPAWNTGKPLSPKLLIMNLRDHLFAKAPYILGSQTAPEDHVPNFHDAGTHSGHDVPEDGYARVKGTNHDQAVRPLVGTAEEGGVIDPDVLWSCTTCGACVEQCPVDIEHVDHILDMRRYQVLIESAFPSEAGVMLRNLENTGNPWGLNNKARTDWMEGLPFEVRVVDGEIPSEVEYLFWVGCAGALEDRSKKVTRAVAELLHTAGVEYAVLGSGETCSGDPARRLGNEFVFQMLAAENVETLNSVGATREHDVKIVATCPHCFNTLANEYPQLGGHYEVVPPHAAARLAAGRRAPRPGRAGRREGHLPRPLLPGSAQQGLHAAARDPRRHQRSQQPGDAALQGARLLLRRRRCAHVDGGEDRQVHQRRAHRRGARPGPRHRLHRLPVLHGDAVRRRHRQAAVRGRPRTACRCSTSRRSWRGRSSRRSRRSSVPVQVTSAAAA